jgi:hypothetical protein
VVRPGYLGQVSTLVCDLCGRSATEAEAGPTWTVSVENGRRRRYCESCSREHLRSMEGRLDSEYF